MDEEKQELPTLKREPSGTPPDSPKSPRKKQKTGFPSADWTVEQVASWLRSYKEGKFYCNSLGQADGEDLFGLDKEDLIRVLGDIRGPSLYSLLHSKGSSFPKTPRGLKDLIPTLNTTKVRPVTYPHTFYGRVEEGKTATEVIIRNYLNRLKTDHKSHYFLLVPGGSGIGKTRFGHELSRISFDLLGNVDKFTALLPEDKRSLQTMLSDPLYLFVDFNNGEKFEESFDTKTRDASIRIGLRLACKHFGLGCKTVLQSEFTGYFGLSAVLELILSDYLSQRSADSPVLVVLHLDEYQIYIDSFKAITGCTLEAARLYFKEMLREIGTFMRSPPEHLSGKFVVIPICTGTSAFDITFLPTEYAKEMISLPPLTEDHALSIVRDAYGSNEHWTEASNKNHFKVVLSDTGYIPRYIAYLVEDNPATLQSNHDWGACLFSRLRSDFAIDIFGGAENARYILYLAFSRTRVTRDDLLPNKECFRSLGDLEKQGVLFLSAVPKSTTEFLVVMPFVLCKIINLLLVHRDYNFFPDDLLFFPSATRPWRWQDFEALYAYVQVAMINSLYTLDKFSEQERHRTVSDLFPGAYGSRDIKRMSIVLQALRVGKEKKQLLHYKTSTAAPEDEIHCEEGDYTFLSVVSQCKENNALIDHRFACQKPDGSGNMYFFIQIKHSQLGMKTKISEEDLGEWYDQCHEALVAFDKLVLVLVTNRDVECTSGFLSAHPDLLVIRKDNLCAFAGLFGQRGLTAL